MGVNSVIEKPHVGGYGYEAYVLPTSKNGHKIDTAIADAVNDAMSSYRQLDGFKMNYLSSAQLNDLCFKVGRRMQSEYTIEKVKQLVSERLNDMCKHNMMIQEVADRRLASFDDDEIYLGLRIWAEKLIDTFDRNYKDTIAKALNTI